MALIVRIAAGPDSNASVLNFESSPVRIGRNRLNDVVLNPLYVSQWHAVIRFEDNDVTVMDLGSTNGTSVNGQRLRREAPMHLTSSNDEVKIGNISLTLGFGTPAVTESEFPQYANLSEDETLFDVFDPGEWLSNLRGDGEPISKDDILVAFAMERVSLLIETFARSYVELRDGTEQFEKEMGLNLVHESTPLHDAKTYRDLLNHLLDWSADTGERIDGVKRSYAELAMHQVALINGVMAGVRALLDELQPRSPAWGRFVPGHSRAMLRDVEKRRRALLEEDRFARVVFGRAFERAYYAVTGRKIER
jgi:pSer/pThr/pTyr-binding forkhead associated (FHA) protein